MCLQVYNLCFIASIVVPLLFASSQSMYGFFRSIGMDSQVMIPIPTQLAVKAVLIIYLSLSTLLLTTMSKVYSIATEQRSVAKEIEEEAKRQAALANEQKAKVVFLFFWKMKEKHVTTDCRMLHLRNNSGGKSRTRQT